MKRVLLVDEHDIVRRGLRALLDERLGLEVVGEARSGCEALEQTRKTDPDIVVIGSPLRDADGDEWIRRLRAAVPAAEIMVYVQQDRDTLIPDLIDGGARAVVLKSDCLDQVMMALDHISIGRRYYSPRVREFLESLSRRKLDAGTLATSPREQQVLQLVADGRTNREIACTLNVSIKTVEAHRASLMHKLNLRNTAGLVRYACAMRLIAA